VARTGFFSRHSAQDAADADERTAERDRRLADTAPTAGERAEAADRAAAEERRAADERWRDDRERVIERPADAETVPETAEPATRAATHGRARTSVLATLALVVGVSATYAALSGRLAPVAVGVGGLGVLLSLGGLSAASRRGVTGHGITVLALVFSLAGIILGVMASRHALPWLNSGTDEAGRLRDWLDARMPWLKHW